MERRRRLARQYPGNGFGEIACFLVGCLGPWWHRALPSNPWCCCAVSDRQDVRVAGGLQCVGDDKLVEVIGFQSSDLFQEAGRLHAGCPHGQICRVAIAVFRFDMVGGYLYDCL